MSLAPALIHRGASAAPSLPACRRRLVLALLATLSPAIASAAEPAAELATTELYPVTVTATLSEQETRHAPASVSIVDRTELEKAEPQNLLEAVRTVPGITLSPRQVGGRKTIALRGMEGRHVLTLVDGRRIVATDDVVGHSDYQYGWLPMAAVERIEVIRGPMSTLYGSEALGGVINLITRRPTDHWEGSLGARGAATADNDGHHAGALSLYAAGPVGERASVRLSGYNAYTPVVADPADARYSEIEGSRSRAGTLGATFRLGEWQQLEFNHFQGLEKRFYDDVSYSGTAYETQYDIHRRQSDVTWRADREAWQGQLRAYRGSTEITNRRTNGVAPTRPQALADEVLDGHAVFEWGAQILTVGGEHRREELENAGLLHGRDAATHQALFAQHEIAFTPRWALTTGVRYDRHELFGHEFSPRAYLVWDATDELVVKGGYGHAFKAPTLKQISPHYVGAEGPHTFLGNANIRPETLDSFELSADWQRGPFNLSAGVFSSRIDDLITYRLIQVTGPRRTYQYDNVDRARVDGVEAGFAWDINAAWTWRGNATVLDTEDRVTGQPLQYRPKSTLGSTLDWTGPDGWSARVGVQRIGWQHSSEGRLPGYALWNASASKRFGEHLSLRLALENLGNLRLAEESPLFGYAERGRTATLDLRVSF